MDWSIASKNHVVHLSLRRIWESHRCSWVHIRHLESITIKIWSNWWGNSRSRLSSPSLVSGGTSNSEGERRDQQRSKTNLDGGREETSEVRKERKRERRRKRGERKRWIEEEKDLEIGRETMREKLRQILDEILDQKMGFILFDCDNFEMMFHWVAFVRQNWCILTFSKIRNRYLHCVNPGHN